MFFFNTVKQLIVDQFASENEESDSDGTSEEYKVITRNIIFMSNKSTFQYFNFLQKGSIVR